MSPGCCRQAFAAICFAFAFLALTATPAAAHGGSHEPGSTNYSTTITDPGITGLEWNVVGGDAYVELTNNTDEQVVILGYQSEPYLRFTPGEGVFENTSAPATYLNQDRYGDVDMPATAAADAPPTWTKVSEDNTYAWHDHRAHWMSRTDPPAVTADPGSEHLISQWSIPIVVGPAANHATVRGDLRWLPNVAWWPPVLILGIVFTAAVALAAVTTRPQNGRWKAPARVATGTIALTIVANVVRTIDELATGTTTLTQQAVVVLSALVALAAILGLSARGWIGHPGGFAAIAGAAMLTMLLFGGGSSGQLSQAIVDTSLPDWFLRWTIAASYTVLAPALLAAIVAGRWYARSDKPTPQLKQVDSFVTPVSRP